MQVKSDFISFATFRRLSLDSSELRKEAVKKWKRECLQPAIEKHEVRWFAAQLAAGTPGVSVLGARFLCPCKSSANALRWAPWSRTTWKFHKAWTLCRLTGALPLSLWGWPNNPATVPTCPGCLEAQVGLQHILQRCVATEQYRRELLNGDATSCLSAEGDEDQLAKRIRFVGLCAVVAAAPVLPDRARR